LHGVEVPDPYRWLEDGKSEEVLAWMRDQDAFARREFANLPLRAALAARLTELARGEEQWAPQPRGGRLFYERRDADRERAAVYVREGMSMERALLDPDTWSDDRTSFPIRLTTTSRKFAAALQAASAGGEVLLRIDWGSGHKGIGLVTPEAEKRAEEYAFLLAAMGIAQFASRGDHVRLAR
jgi:prolyl oligopeptidase